MQRLYIEIEENKMITDELLKRDKLLQPKKISVSGINTNEVELKEAQFAFKELEKPAAAKLFQNTRCPRRCEGRISNKGNCTNDNCIKINRDKISIAAIRKVARNSDKVIVRKLNGRDKKLLDNVSMFGKLSSEYHYRNVGRPEIKRQLQTLGASMPRLKNVDARKLHEINTVRSKLGLVPLADLSHLITGRPKLVAY